MQPSLIAFFFWLTNNSPVLGAALLNLGRWSDATRELSKCLKEPKHGMNAAMDTVRHLARARGALNQHKRAAREILKYCQHRFSPKRSGYQNINPSDRRRDQYACYEIVGKSFSLARNSGSAFRAYQKALETRPIQFQNFFHPSVMADFYSSGEEKKEKYIWPKKVVLSSNRGEAVRNFSLFWTIVFLVLTFDTHFCFQYRLLSVKIF